MDEYAYDDTPHMAQVPLVVEDVAELLARQPRDFQRDPAQVWHFVSRALATAQTLRTQALQFDEEITRRSHSMPSSGIPGNLSPEQAARYLSPQQLARLFDAHARTQLAALDARQQQLHTRLELLRGALAELETLAADAATDADVPETVRDRLVQLAVRARTGLRPVLDGES